jgi:diadenylate cyclase
MFGLDFFGTDLFMDKPTLMGIGTVILDLLLVTFVVYRFIILVRGTRAFLMLIGLLIILGISSLISHYMDLFTIQWLLANVLSYFFLFIIIIFQHEIRRALTRVGSGMTFFAPAQKAREAFEEVIEAVDRMAQIRLGTIIVFEREGSVADQILTGGETIDGRISKELLWSIFNVTAENPLHDGAVIIKNNRVFKAGVLLPLSENKDIATNYGTRHRAALGITEKTDAIAIVVSEERGTISICEQGKLIPMENLSRLRNEFGRLLRNQALTPSKWWESGGSKKEKSKEKSKK